MAASSSNVASKPTIGILSIGDMGMGLAKLLRAHDYQVLTATAGRSQATLDRIKKAEVIALPTDEALVAEADIILSIVPPRDAIATAKRIVEACKSPTSIKRRSERRDMQAIGQAPSLTFIDCNAISPRSIKVIAHMTAGGTSPTLTRTRTRSFPFLQSEEEPAPEPIGINLLDGGIIGGPPALNKDESTWKKPALVMSGPNQADLLTPDLISTLNIRPVSSQIGSASALKSCFAALNKGVTAIAVLSFTTAQTCGVLPALKSHLKEYSPAILQIVERSLPNMPPKAYRWIDEMRQLGETFSDDGGFGAGLGGAEMFEGAAQIYELVTQHTVLGTETIEARKRGTTADDVAKCVQHGIRKRKRGPDADEEDLSLTWRGSWS